MEDHAKSEHRVRKVSPALEKQPFFKALPWSTLPFPQITQNNVSRAGPISFQKEIRRLVGMFEARW